MSAPDLTLYRIVHRAIRGGTAALAETALTLHTAAAERRSAYARYWKGYAGEVLHHHSVEDEIFFPALVERVPVAAEMIRRTDADHEHLDELMDAIEAAVAEVREHQPSPDLVELTRELDDHMTAHLDFEDSDVLPLFERHFSAEEYEVLDARAVKSAGVGAQTFFSVPMLVGAMTDEERGPILAGAPLPLRVVHRLSRRSHARLVERAFGHQIPAVGSRASQVG